MNDTTDRLVLRYRQPQRWVHWIGATGFVLLLLSGMALLVPPLSFLAAGGWSRLVHQVGAILFLAWVPLYAVLYPNGLKQLLRDSFTYGRDDWAWAKKAPGYFFGRAHDMPPQGRINAGEKAHHAASILAFVMVALSGFVLWFAKGMLGADWLAVVAMVHDVSMLGLIVLFIGHLYFTFVYDALSGMKTGYVTQEYAQMEHAKWLAQLPQEPPYIIQGKEKPIGT